MSDAHPLGRQIRVFISSTFRDMQADRDVLVKKTFPQLRKLCESRAVTWTEVDLRWGITTEQQAEGKVLPYCLAEIERTRPFFIGLLGERYGWVPESIPADLLEQQPWLREHLEHSVTELEILHGVLNNPAMADRALFYFRDPAYAAAAPGGKKDDFVETGPDAERMQGKLRSLKKRIRTAAEQKKLKHPPRENYADPESLGALILADFTQIIDELYPAAEVPDPLDQEAARHEAYARSRRFGFVGRGELLRRLNEHCTAPGQPLVLTGESGCGKSALLAEWVHEWRETHSDDLILQHYIGSTPDSADWPRLVRRILAEIKRTYAITGDIPAQPEALRNALSEWIIKASGSHRIVLVVDALDQLPDGGAARQLGWLPTVFPANFRVLISSLPGEALDALRKRGGAELHVPLFGKADIAPAVAAYFQLFGKTPPKEMVTRLESVPAACNALYLRTVLNELRQFGEYAKLQATANDYLSSPSLPELFDRILARWETDFGADLVRTSLSLVWAARRGLSEAEILDLLGEHSSHDWFTANSKSSVTELRKLLDELHTPRAPLPRARWTPFFLASEAEVTNQAGVLTFSHSHFRDAVEKRYLPGAKSKRAAHERLALYFDSLPLPARIGVDGSIHIEPDAVASSRALDEEPWQLQAACRWEALADHLSFMPVFIAAWGTGREFEWMQYWQSLLTAAKVGVASPVDIPALYLTAFHRLGPADRALTGGMVGQFLYALDYFDAALECFEKQGKGDAVVGDPFLRAITLNDKGLVERDRGNDQQALALFEEAAALVENGGPRKGELQSQRNEHRLLASILMNEANSQKEINGTAGCRSLLDRALALMKETTGERSPEVATVLQETGNLAMTEGNPEKALDLHLQALAIRREGLGLDHHDVALSFGNAANALGEMGHYYYATCLWERSLRILKKTVGDGHHFSRAVATPLAQCAARADAAAKSSSGFGIVLLVFNSLPPTENPPDPGTSEGAQLMARAVSDTLIEIWDDCLAYSSIPVLIVSFPGYEDAVRLATEKAIARRYSQGFLSRLRIPSVRANITLPIGAMRLMSVKRKFLNWLQEHKVDVLMIKPVTSCGATLDRHILGYVRRSFSEGSSGHSKLQPKSSDESSMDLRPIAIETVPLDQFAGPILALYTGDNDRRPCILTASEVRRQNYCPQAADSRATGVIYANMPAIRRWLSTHSGSGLTPLERWSIDLFHSIASRPREEQYHVFESLLSALILLIKTKPISFPSERGIRGFQEQSLNREIERLLA